MLNSVIDVIDALGGHTAVAALARVSLPAVSNWIARGEFPPEYFVLFRDALAASGKEVDESIFRFKEPVADEARA